MLENINDALFAFINATPASPSWVIALATFIAKDVILIVPLLAAALWLWGPNQRQLVFKVLLALAISLSLSWIFGLLFPHERPFVAGIGYQFHQLYLCAGFLVLASPVVRDRAAGNCRGDRLVPGLSWRSLAAGYAGRPADRDVRLPGRRITVAGRRSTAVSIPAAAVSGLLLPADS